MHGCVTRPSDIVLTREHYIRYAERYAALGGVVQGTLLTKHLLYLGFSLADTNFHRIFESVRAAMPMTGAKSAGQQKGKDADEAGDFISKRKYRTPKKLRGGGEGGGGGRGGGSDEGQSLRDRNTAIFIEANELNKELWHDDVSIVTMRTSDESLLQQQLRRHRRLKRRENKRSEAAAAASMTMKVKGKDTVSETEQESEGGILAAAASMIGKSGMELLRGVSGAEKGAKAEEKDDGEDSDDGKDNRDDDDEDDDDDLDLEQDNKDFELEREDFGLLCRRHDIFLDLLSACCAVKESSGELGMGKQDLFRQPLTLFLFPSHTQTAYLFVDRFTSLLNEPEQKLKRLLRNLSDSVKKDARTSDAGQAIVDSPAWHSLERALVNLGMRPIAKSALYKGELAGEVSQDRREGKVERD